jgi:hypothetical protein
MPRDLTFCENYELQVDISSRMIPNDWLLWSLRIFQQYTSQGVDVHGTGIIIR